MSNTPLTFRYPSYSEHYFSRKKELESRLRDELKTLSDMQPFYESCLAILRKHTFSNEIKIEQFSTTIEWRITLTPSDSLRLLKPLIEDVEAFFNKKARPQFQTWNEEVEWSLHDPDWKCYRITAFLPK